uniref:Parathyroid hormone n=1 Tax=Neogobius melanostomus TaxID=47308 RepID=A0A8C6SJW7_9GOBI
HMMFSLKSLRMAILILVLAILFSEAKPLRKRTISEVQLMHNVREHKQVGERQDWLHEKLKDIIVASVKPQHVRPVKLKTLVDNDETEIKQK